MLGAKTVERHELEVKAAAAVELRRRKSSERTVWGIVCPTEGLIRCITNVDGEWVETSKKPHVYAAKKLERAITTRKRFLILLGGRASTKSVFGVDLSISEGKDYGDRTYFLREFQSSIKNSVHSLVSSQIEKCQYYDFQLMDSSVKYKDKSIFEFAGIARNTDSVKSTHGFKRFSIEEAQFISKKSLTALTPSLRKDTEIGLPKKFRDEENSLVEDIGSSDLSDVSMLFVANPMSSADPFSQRFIEPYKKYLDRDGFYEDEIHLIIKINYLDNPWFDDSGLKAEMEWDYENRSRAEADHIWMGEYNDSVENAIITADKFDACIDAHKIEHLQRRFRPTGKVVASHDPSGEGDDNKGYAVRHGSIIKRVTESLVGDVDEGFDWAIDLAIKDCADWFVYDADGMGSGAKRQVSDALRARETRFHGFRGSLSGSAQDNAEDVYLPLDDHKDTKPKKYMDEFLNNRAQYYIGELARRVDNTYRCVVKDEYFDADDMISFDSEGIENMAGLRSELCRIPLKPNGRGLKQVMSKQDMKKLGIDSPGMADSIMMTMFKPPIERTYEPIDYPEMSIV